MITPESIFAYPNTLWLNRWKNSLTVFPKNSIHSKPAVGKPCSLIRGHPYYPNRIWSLLMTNTTIFKWKLIKCTFLKCSCDENNAYHCFFVCSKISAFRPNRIVLLDIDDTDSKILKEFITSSKNYKNLARDIFTSRNSCSPQLKIEPNFTSYRKEWLTEYISIPSLLIYSSVR